MKVSKLHYAMDSSEVKQISKTFAHDNLPEVMKKLGFGIDVDVAMDMARMYGFAMDSIQGNVTTPNIPGLIQFLQNWLPGQVMIQTADRAADRLMGVATMGEFSDEQIVQEVIENTGYPRPYTDDGNVPLSDFNLTQVTRTNIRFELGMRVGILEEERSARVRVNAGQAKRESCGVNLEITRNLVAFNGYNSGNDNTYGFLNDPGLLAIQEVANGATGSPEWSTKTFLEIQQDLLIFFNALLTDSKGVVDPMRDPTILALPQNAVTYMARTSDFGISVMKWLNDTYPKCKVENAIQLNTAAGAVTGDGVAYLYAERVQDNSTDDGRVWLQVVPQRFRVLGVQKLIKGWQEGYANATSGAMCKRPYAVVRYQGVS